MKARTIFTSFMLLAVVLAGCASATPTAPAGQTPAATSAGAAASPTAASTSAGTASSAGGTIKVALLAPLSGQNPTFGISQRNAVTMAVNEWNAKGGLLGKQIELIVQDSQCAPDPAVNAANLVINQNKVHYIIGETCSSASIPVSVIAEQDHVLMISPTSTNPTVTLNQDGSTKHYVYRACFIDPFQGLVMAKFATQQGLKTAFVMYDQGNDYVRGLAEAFKKSFTDLGGQVVGTETYTSQDTDFSAILTKVASSGAQILYVPDYYPIVNLVGTQAKDKGITAVMMGGDGWDSADLDLKAADGGYFSNHYSYEDPRPEVQDWVKKYQAQYGQTPDALGTLGYDAANILFTSIQTAGKDDVEAVLTAMQNGTFNVVSGKVTFDAQHNPTKSAAVMQVKDGKINYVTTINP
jgi:branched-chain amino acid transport system substrate-binding protein